MNSTKASLLCHVGVAVWMVAVLLVGAIPRAQAADLLVPFFTDDGGGPGSVQRYKGRTGKSLGTFVAADAGGLSGPEQLVFGPDNNLYVGSFNSNQVLRYDGRTGKSLGTFVAADAGGLSGPTGVVFGQDNNLYVSSNATGEVLRYNGRTGAFLGTFIAAGGGLEDPAFLTFTPVPESHSRCHPHRTDDDQEHE